MEHGYRLGVVSFLNSRPLIDGLEGDGRVQLTCDVPAALPARLADGSVDVALIPIVDVLRSAGRYRVVSDACIACDGETMTVRVFSQVPPHRVQRLSVDGDSHTSVALARVLWRELFDVDLEVERIDARATDLSRLEAVLLIGDKVVDPARSSFGYEVDLGGAWKAHTGLPFVFAVWAANDDATEGANGTDDDVDAGETARPSGRDPAYLHEVAALLSAARDRGVARAGDIAEQQGPAMGWPIELARRYLTRCLKFTLDAGTIEGADRFGQLCSDLGVLSAPTAIRWPEDLASKEPVG